MARAWLGRACARRREVADAPAGCAACGAEDGPGYGASRRTRAIGNASYRKTWLASVRNRVASQESGAGVVAEAAWPREQHAGEAAVEPAGAGLSITHLLGAADSSARLAGSAGGDVADALILVLDVAEPLSRSETVRPSSLITVGLRARGHPQVSRPETARAVRTEDERLPVRRQGGLNI